MKTLIVPTASLANLVYKAVRAGKLPYNYCVACWDCSGGIYIQLAVAEWATAVNTRYVVPHTRH